jgi:hypothetical protein
MSRHLDKATYHAWHAAQTLEYGGGPRDAAPELRAAVEEGVSALRQLKDRRRKKAASDGILAATNALVSLAFGEDNQAHTNAKKAEAAFAQRLWAGPFKLRP